jgi:hypothetical protein
MTFINSMRGDISIKSSKPIFDFTMGADPELVVKDGATVLGDKILTEYDEFGIDGNHYWFEIRPDPSKSPLEVANNIRSIMVRQCLKRPAFLNYDWFAGSFASNPNGDYGLGGHIHFGVKGDRISPDTAALVLSQYVGAATLLIEDRDQGLKRRHFKGGKYGFINDQREKPYGFEYRSPSSWLTDPKVTIAVLCLAKTVLFELLNNDKFNPSKRIKESHFINMEVDSVREVWPDIWDEITRMSLYAQYKPYIDVLYFMIKRHRMWFPAVSLREAWGVVNSTNVSKIPIASIWYKFLDKKNDGEFIPKLA